MILTGMKETAEAYLGTNIDAMQSMQRNRCNAIDALQSMQCNRCNAINAMQSMQCNRCNAIDAMQGSGERNILIYDMGGGNVVAPVPTSRMGSSR